MITRDWLLIVEVNYLITHITCNWVIWYLSIRNVIAREAFLVFKRQVGRIARRQRDAMFFRHLVSCKLG